ncbi:Mo-dependent nitrogenase C-terminal domain-containing protein [Cyanobacterium sp. IPPAS B-1200]|uniref:Mo-dependent nitrogenase C-terminal domain-containing protein n=1 Tax=Cyanobacterium sp. IPPAS B-1200 TaxID=1562720 RepID=UPI00085252B1|nr:Mo-dependent nitrogenase C-terminal domain-containing protein [Cyanobacterium sp. IPPAS B-1200]OEJ78133.1 nitrogenase [Cyanobacterium sp. IPPAS B-1200]
MNTNNNSSAVVTSEIQKLDDRTITAWLRGLLTVAYADGHFDPEEQDLIASLTQDELMPNTNLGDLEPISPQDLATELGEDTDIRENFLRTAVMMAIANGVYSQAEADAVHSFHKALDLDIEALKSLEATLWNPTNKDDNTIAQGKGEGAIDVLNPVKKWLDGMDINDPRVARFLCKMIPPQCPFERDIKLFGKKIVHIPPMCKLNPLYEQLVGLRFRSLSYLADDCNEDISNYI